MSNKRRQLPGLFKRRRVWIGLAVGVVVTVIVMALGREVSLLDRAERKPLSADDYAWIAGAEAGSGIQLFCSREQGQGEYQPYVVDLETGEERELDQLLHLFAGHEKRSHPFTWSVSPDGKRMIVAISEPEETRYVVVSIADGKTLMEWRGPWGGSVFEWSANGEWAGEEKWGGGISVGGTRIGRRFDLEANRVDEVEVRVGFELLPRLVGFNAEGTPILLDESPMATNLRRVAGSQDDNRHSSQQLLVGGDLPGARLILLTALSSDGERLAILATCRSPIPRVEKRSGFPYFGFDSRSRMEVWVGNIGNGDFVKVGRCAPDVLIWDLQWKPGGGAISFRHGNELYTLPLTPALSPR